MWSLGIGIDDRCVAALYRAFLRDTDLKISVRIIFFDLFAVTDAHEIPDDRHADLTFFNPA